MEKTELTFWSKEKEGVIFRFMKVRRKGKAILILNKQGDENYLIVDAQKNGGIISDIELNQIMREFMK